MFLCYNVLVIFAVYVVVSDTGSLEELVPPHSEKHQPFSKSSGRSRPPGCSTLNPWALMFTSFDFLRSSMAIEATFDRPFASFVPLESGLKSPPLGTSRTWRITGGKHTPEMTDDFRYSRRLWFSSRKWTWELEITWVCGIYIYYIQHVICLGFRLLEGHENHSPSGRLYLQRSVTSRRRPWADHRGLQLRRCRHSHCASGGMNFRKWDVDVVQKLFSFRLTCAWDGTHFEVVFNLHSMWTRQKTRNTTITQYYKWYEQYITLQYNIL